MIMGAKVEKNIKVVNTKSLFAGVKGVKLTLLCKNIQFFVMSMRFGMKVAKNCVEN